MHCAVIEFLSGKRTMFRHKSGVSSVSVGYEGRKFRAKVVCNDGTVKKFDGINTAYKDDDLSVVCKNMGL